MAWIGQREGEGGIVDMFMRDIRSERPSTIRTKSQKKLVIAYLENNIHRNREMLKRVRSMQPQG